MVALLTPDLAAMASTLVASIPFSANSSRAASRTLWCARWLRPRATSDLDLRKTPGAEDQHGHRDQRKSKQVRTGAEDHQAAGENAAQAVHSVRERIGTRNRGQHLRQIGQRIESNGKKKDGQDQEIHNELKALHVLQARADGGAKRRKNNGDESHENKGQGNRNQVDRPETGDHADQEDQRPLQHRHRRTAERSANHDANARHRGHQRFFQEPELPVEKQCDSREHRSEKNGHSDHARSYELQIAAVARLLEYGSEAESEDQQIQQGLAERGHNLGAGSRVLLDLTKPENKNRVHDLSPPHLGELTQLVGAGIRRFVANGGSRKGQKGVFEGFAVGALPQFL